MCPCGIGFDYARIDREAFARDEPLVHAALQHRLNRVPKSTALAKAAVPVLRERRVPFLHNKSSRLVRADLAR
jgi:hypothetical protein